MHKKEIDLKNPKIQKIIKSAAGITATLAVIGFGWMIFALSDTELTPVGQPSETSTQSPVRNLGVAIEIVEGSVEESSNGSDWSAVEGGESLASGDYVRTLNSSRAVLLFDEGSALRLGADTTVSLKKLSANKITIELQEGVAYSRVLESDSRTFTVTTSNDSYTALGTAFSTSSLDDIDELRVFASKVAVNSSGQEVEEGSKYSSDDEETEDLTQKELTEDDFTSWNKELDSKNSEYSKDLGVLKDTVEPSATPNPTSTPTTPPTTSDTETTTPSITLSGTTGDNSINLSWTIAGDVELKDGYKIVYSKTASAPTYAIDSSNYIGESSARSYGLGLKDGETYNVRICAYRPDSSSCDTYSNTVVVKAPLKEIEKPVLGGISLNASGNTVTWEISGTAPHGFKVVANQNGAPLYPNDSIKFVGSKDRSTDLSFEKEGTYSVRVCKYTASDYENGCVDYSNEVQIEITKE